MLRYEGSPAIGLAVTFAALAGAAPVLAAPAATTTPLTVTSADSDSATVALDVAVIRNMAGRAATFTLQQFPLIAT